MTERSLLKQIFTNLTSVFKRRKAEFRGRDYNGTEYFEDPNTVRHLNRTARWFNPINPNDFEQEIPPEWQAWLRHKRKDPPTEEEIQLSLLMMQKVLENAKKLEGARSPKPSQIKKPEESDIYTESGFPKYKEYSLEPGHKNDQ